MPLLQKRGSGIWGKNAVFVNAVSEFATAKPLKERSIIGRVCLEE